jgi:hypothetical protein
MGHFDPIAESRNRVVASSQRAIQHHSVILRLSQYLDGGAGRRFLSFSLWQQGKTRKDLFSHGLRKQGRCQNEAVPNCHFLKAAQAMHGVS